MHLRFFRRVLPVLASLLGGLLFLLAGAGRSRALAAPPLPVDDPPVVELFKIGQSSLLPDLHTLPHQDIYLQKIANTDIVRLRFSNTIWNSGPGDLEMFGALQRLFNRVQVFQVIENELGRPFRLESGFFGYHEEHGHWHWDGFSIYRVWSIDREGRLVDIVASSGKVGYCLIDVDPYGGPAGSSLNPKPFRQFSDCEYRIQGLSAGWTDTYKADIGGQFVDISNLPDGSYALVSTVDPQNIIVEANDINNSALTYFRLVEGQLVIDGSNPVWQGSGLPAK